jgi:hypothetical protein
MITSSTSNSNQRSALETASEVGAVVGLTTAASGLFLGARNVANVGIIILILALVGLIVSRTTEDEN